MAKKKMVTPKRSLFRELMAGVDAMRQHREGRLTLRTHHVEPISLPELEPRVVRETRESLHMSRQVFAFKLGVNPRTLGARSQQTQRAGRRLDLAGAQVPGYPRPPRFSQRLGVIWATSPRETSGDIPAHGRHRSQPEGLPREARTQGQIHVLRALLQLLPVALHLGFYLASWGMLRGSSELLQRSVRDFIPLVEVIANAAPPTWEMDAQVYGDGSCPTIEARYLLGGMGPRPRIRRGL